MVWVVGVAYVLGGCVRTKSQVVFPPMPVVIPTISDQEMFRGWYFGSIGQKKPGTPKDWQYEDRGKSSCWHQNDRQCQ